MKLTVRVRWRRLWPFQVFARLVQWIAPVVARWYAVSRITAWLCTVLWRLGYGELTMGGQHHRIGLPLPMPDFAVILTESEEATS